MDPENIPAPDTYALPAESAAAGTEAASETVPSAPIEELRRRINALEERLSRRPAAEPDAVPEQQFEPDLDVYENDREFLIHAAVPGAEPEQIRIEATSHTVTLAADIAGAPQDTAAHSAWQNGKRHRRSRHAGHDHYHLVYTFHVAIRPERARAAFRNGIVEIHLEKALGAPESVAVPVLLSGDLLSGRPPVEAVVRRGISPMAVHTREGSPGQKMGAAYAANAGEDHTSKAQSVGEQGESGRTVGMSDRLRTSESGGAEDTPSNPAEPAQR